MTVRILHVSDVHFGRDAQLAQLEAIEEFAPAVEPDAITLSGDLTQRARHGEFQAAHAFLKRLGKVAPTLVVPGNHDVEWWRSPFHLLGRARIYEKYRKWFGDDLTPVLRIPGAIIAGAISAHGVAVGSLTWNLRDLAVKGHLPRSETDRIRRMFDSAEPGAAKVLVMHHNVLPGRISERKGLADWRGAHRRIDATGADLVLCGHDHQEHVGTVAEWLAVSTASTQTSRTRGGHPSVFNVVRIEPSWIEIEHYRWEPDDKGFVPSDRHRFARRDERQAPGQEGQEPVVSVAGGDEPL